MSNRRANARRVAYKVGGKYFFMRLRLQINGRWLARENSILMMEGKRRHWLQPAPVNQSTLKRTLFIACFCALTK